MLDLMGEPSKRSLRANTVLLDGEPAGIIGVVRYPEHGTFFTEISPQLQPYLKSITVWRAIKDAHENIVKRYKGPVLSIADHVEGCLNLQRLGFTHLHGAWYGWLG